MSPTQLFHIPSALKRSRSTAVTTQTWQPDGNDSKVQHILGVSEADINTARNRSHSSATAKLQDVSLSEATTELGSYVACDDKPPQLPELHLKASSVLLHDDGFKDIDGTASVHSKNLRKYDSSSTLHSHYDPRMAPLAISQQTSDSSRRDFALRKGSPVVIGSDFQDKDSARQLRFFKSSKSRDNSESRKPVKSRPHTGSTSAHPSSSQRSATSSDWIPISPGDAAPQSMASASDTTPKPSTTFRLLSSGQSPSSATERATRTQNSLLHPMDPSYVKINIRRPKAGVKHWFDDLDGESSEEEAIDEPELEQSFVTGIETAFQTGRIKASPSDSSTIKDYSLETRPDPAKLSTLKDRHRSPRKTLDTKPIPRVAVLNAQLAQPYRPSEDEKGSPVTRLKASPFAKVNLNQQSVLNLSSSDDEEDPLPTGRVVESALSGPMIRESLDLFTAENYEYEIGTAEAVSAQRALVGQSTSHLRRLEPGHQVASGNVPLRIPQRQSSRITSSLSDSLSDREPPVNEIDLLTFFPPTPVETTHSQTTSIRSSVALSDAGSIDSRRLMSVTKQEEALLAAMRTKKASMQTGYTQDRRLDALRSLEKGGYQKHPRTMTGMRGFESHSQLSLDSYHPHQLHSTTAHRRSLSGDDGFCSRASGTTFQTNTSRNPSRLSRATILTDMSVDPDPRYSLASEHNFRRSDTPSVLSLNTEHRRTSRDTYFSNSSGGHPGHSRTITERSHVVTLDELDKIPKRDEIPSQEFIDWPYNGWEARAELGLAH